MARKKPTTKKDKRQERCRMLVGELMNLCAPGVIQKLLAEQYEYLSGMSQMEAEIDFWNKCTQASSNLSSGMNKWAHEMLDILEGGDDTAVEETEGG